jgi:hypothetical protein
MKIILPFSVAMPRKKGPNRIWILNLNSYRNTHYHTLNQSKVLWKDVVWNALESFNVNGPGAIVPPFRFTYTAFPATNRKFDLGNVLSIVQKFTDDALIELGIIPDDSYKVIPAIDYRFGGVDKENPRIELEITGC